MNHEELLKKYIEYIGDVEGMDYIEHDSLYVSDVRFTDEEWRELTRLANEVNTARQART